MKIIELLNKIANNEKVPKKIKVSCYEFKWREVGRYYINTTKGRYQSLVQDWLDNANKLNSEVEIIEDEEIDIQNIEDLGVSSNNVGGKIAELTKAVKQLEKKVNSIEQKVKKGLNK